MKSWKDNSFSTLICFFGPAEFFHFQGCNILREYWTKITGSKAQTLEAHDIQKSEQFTTIWEQRSMLEQNSLYIIPRVEKIRDFNKKLNLIPMKNKIDNPICLSYVGSKIPSNLEKNLNRLRFELIPCFQATDQEIPLIISDFLKKHRLKLHTDSIKLLLAHIGNDLFKLENEIKKLSLLFPSTTKILQCDDIAHFLGLLREDHAFKLTQFFLGHRYNEALLFCDHLLQRGESTIAILGILSRHIRTALKISSLNTKNIPISEQSRSLFLPYSITSSYHKYLSKVSDKILEKSLLLCQQTDMNLKSSRRIPEDLALSTIISTLQV